MILLASNAEVGDGSISFIISDSMCWRAEVDVAKGSVGVPVYKAMRRQRAM